MATLDRDRHFTRNSVHNTYPRSASVSAVALVAVLNSQLINTYYRIESGEIGRAFPQVHIARLKRFPIAPGLVDPGAALEQLALKRLQAGQSVNSPDAAMLDIQINEAVNTAYGATNQDAEAASQVLRGAA